MKLRSPGATSMERGFTLIEVMIALAVVGIALVSLLALQHQSLQSVIRSSEMSRAALLAQGVMSEAEIERFPELGRTQGNFESTFPGRYRNFRWERSVEQSAIFPDIRTVYVRVYFGPKFSREFDLVELLRNPLPPGLPQ